MDSLLFFIYSHASWAHWVIFSLFMLSGVNFPFSEDLLIIAAATLASTLCPENFWKLYFAVFLGAYLSDSIPYWLGRRFGADLWKLHFFERMVKKERLEQVRHYFAQYGALTLIVGRFIPFGFRNCLFAAAGMGKMPYPKFLLCDGLACLISSTTLFSLSYVFSKHTASLLQKLKWMNLTIFFVFLIALMAVICYKIRKRKNTPRMIE